MNNCVECRNEGKGKIQNKRRTSPFRLELRPTKRAKFGQNFVKGNAEGSSSGMGISVCGYYKKHHLN